MKKFNWTKYYDSTDREVKEIAVHNFYPRNWFQRLLVTLVQQFVLEHNTKHRAGDLINYGETNYGYEFVNIYYDRDLKPICFIKDPADGRIFGVPMYLCKSPYTR